MKEYQSIVLNGYSTKPKIDSLLNDLAVQGYTIKTIIMDNIIVMERDALIQTCCGQGCHSEEK